MTDGFEPLRETTSSVEITPPNPLILQQIALILAQHEKIIQMNMNLVAMMCSTFLVSDGKIGGTD